MIGRPARGSPGDPRATLPRGRRRTPGHSPAGFSRIQRAHAGAPASGPTRLRRAASTAFELSVFSESSVSWHNPPTPNP